MEIFMPKKATIVSGIALVLLSAMIFTITAAVRIGQDKKLTESLPGRVSVLFPELNEIRMMKYEEFLCGCVAGLLSDIIGRTDPPREAVKAAAAAVNSRAAYHLNNNDAKDENFGADFAVGEDFPFIEEENDKISRIIDQLSLLTYEGEPINALTCKISAGVTDAAAPYSPSVPLLCDVSANGYDSSIAFTSESVRRALHQNAISQNFVEWFHDPVYAETGTLIYIGFCGTKITGETLKKALGLRSTAITVEYRDDKFYFYCKGLGENKGMSINAAIFLAQNGKTAEEILSLFYPQCALSS